MVGVYCCVPLSAQPQRNIEMLDTLARKASMQLAVRVRVLRKVENANKENDSSKRDTLYFSFAPHPAAWLLEQYLLPDLAPTWAMLRRLRAADTAQTRKHGLLSLRVTDCAVRYFPCDHSDDSLTREAHIIVVASMEEASGLVMPIPTTALDYRDTVARRSITGLESKQYEFANSSVPEPQKTFWKTVVEPAIVVAAAVITVVLLFTVRTQ
jgi:hypothetical protein